MRFTNILLFITFFLFYITIVCEAFEQKLVLYNGDYWNEYRIGDLFRFGSFVGCGKKNPNCMNDKYHEVAFPNSIAFYYHKYNPTNIQSNTASMKKAIDTVSKQLRTPSFECVLHMRVGDVMLLADKKKVVHYTKLDDFEWWQKVMTWVKEHNIKHITIIAGSHTSNIREAPSMTYILQTKKLFEKNNINVTLQIGGSPDLDIVTACNAKHFITTGGTYGKLIKQLALLNNVTVFEPDVLYSK